MKKSILKKTVSILLAFAMIMPMFGNMPTNAETLSYPYALFAADNTEEAISAISTSNFTINGGICTNGIFTTKAQNPNINGSLIENANENMIYIFDKIGMAYFEGNNLEIYYEDYDYSYTNINQNNPLLVAGELKLTGNINLNASIMALSDIVLNGEVKNSNNSVIYSKYGNIVINNNSNVNLNNGLIYAPFGNVEINSMNVNVNGIIIAQSITFNSPNVNVNYNSNIGNFVGNESEELNLPIYEWAYLDDTDGDALPDILEINTFGTDPLNPDTDGDGLPDGYEVLVIGTDPLEIDSDDNGISDSDEDFDEDGLCNFDEYLYDSDPWDGDSDEDGLTDGDEVHIYGTSPINSDTDNDELTDDMELKYGMEPTNPDTLNDGILDGNRIFNITSEDISDNGDVKMFISVDLQGKNINSFTSERVSEDDYFLNPEIPGYLGNAFDFNVNGTFSKATLTYELDEELFDSSDFVPAIYYWNEEEQFLFELPNQTIVGNTVSVELEHFSKYVVIAKNKYDQKLFEFEILPPTNEEYQNKKFDVALVLDESGSISYRDFASMKNLCADLVSTFDESDRISIYTFDNTIRRHSGFTDKNSAISTLSKLNMNGGGTAIYNAIYSATNEFISYSNSDATKIMIVLTDGQDLYSTYTPSAVTQRALNNNIIIYTIGIGSVNTNALNYIADSTGGAYYSAANFSQLEGIFDRLISDADLYRDSDDDKISDYHEKKISAGELKGGAGAPVKDFANLDYLNPDSDSDGIIDGKEFVIRNQEVQGRLVYYCYLYSNPCMVDSDNDGLLDGKEQRDIYGKIIAPKDQNPLVADGPIGVWKEHISSTVNGTPSQYATGSDAYRSINFPVPESIPAALKYTLKGIGALAANVGGIVLDFKLDSEGQAFHSNVQNWQKIGGYNILYDEIFRIGTYDVINNTKTISKEMFKFSVGSEKYVVWVWRGNYLNLGAGAEIGLYTNPHDRGIYVPNFDSFGDFFTNPKFISLWEQWDVPGIESFNPFDLNKTPSLTLPMTLSLYQDNHNQSYEKIFNWAPKDGQWWITGFNNNYMFPNSENLVSIGSINFEGHEDMYRSLKDEILNDPDLREYMIFDNENKTAWLIWNGV